MMVPVANTVVDDGDVAVVSVLNALVDTMFGTWEADDTMVRRQWLPSRTEALDTIIWHDSLVLGLMPYERREKVDMKKDGSIDYRGTKERSDQEKQKGEQRIIGRMTNILLTYCRLIIKNRIRCRL